MNEKIKELSNFSFPFPSLIFLPPQIVSSSSHSQLPTPKLVVGLVVTSYTIANSEVERERERGVGRRGRGGDQESGRKEEMAENGHGDHHHHRHVKSVVTDRKRRSNPSTESGSVHAYAHSGDLKSLTQLLHESPSLLNARTSVISEAPLHYAASSNEIEVVRYLLDLEGPEKAQLKAENMFGETPLHVAAKSGSQEVVQLLLDHGALLEAKAKNGMTPLLLAAWSSLQRDNYVTVKALLDRNADCEATDSEGKTALDYLGLVSGTEKVRELIQIHLQKQRERKATKTCAEANYRMAEFDDELSTLVGLHDLKLQLRKWAKGVILDERRRALGLKVAARRIPHMAFLGNPGTGKTLIARMLGKLLHKLGILSKDCVTEVQRTDLVGEFVGHTGPKTRRKIAEAMGGILFIDEAYRLIPAQKADDKDYGLEALEEVMSVMDSGNVVVIFAGYCEPMKRVISANEGFTRRVARIFYFDDYNARELAEITDLKMRGQAEDSLLYGFELHGDCSIESMAKLIEMETTEKQRQEMNGGLVDSMLLNARENLDLRLDPSCEDLASLITIKMEDLRAGLRSFLKL